MKNLRLVVCIILLDVLTVFAQITITSINTDKARYSPGDTVAVTIGFSSQVTGKQLSLEYLHLDSVIQYRKLTLTDGTVYSTVWKTPPADFKGYLLVVRLFDGMVELDRTAIGIDVSSNWSKFPRYGFLSSFPILSTTDVDAVIGNLNRYHINGLQFYDWHWKHHKPLKGTPASPAAYWNDIANRTIYLSTVQKYLAAAKSRGMKTMAYNLLYGAYADAANDGVSNEWRMFSDKNHQSPLYHQLPASWASNIYLIDHSNPLWVQYITAEMRKVFQALPFDGWHVDQLGTASGNTYAGQTINMAAAFETFLRSAKDSLQVPMVCNAVNQFAQSNIAKTSMDFLYSEVWTPNDKFGDLVNIVFYNNYYSNNKLASVLAAYVNKGLSGSSGYFNTPAVLFTNAAIFAAGGSHLELGEHMLGNEYFPNNNLKMRPELKTALVKYYDFLTAYENILRDSISGISLGVATSSYASATWPPQTGKIWLYPRARKNRLIIHAVNFLTAATIYWRDDNNTQTVPALLENVTLSIPLNKAVKKVWYTSPDNADIAPDSIGYTRTATGIELQIPRLQYWSVVVVEYWDDITGIHDAEVQRESFILEQNYPNPFNPSTTIRYRTAKTGLVSLKLYDVLGREVQVLRHGEEMPGIHEVTVDGGGLASGFYFYKLQTEEGTTTKKMLLLK